MKLTCKILAHTELVLGAIGSVCLANTWGRSIDLDTLEMVRNNTLTSIIFLSSLLGVIVIWALLYSAGKILENQEAIMSHLGITSKPSPSPAPSPAPRREDDSDNITVIDD